MSERKYPRCAGCDKPFAMFIDKGWTQTGHVKIIETGHREMATWCPDCSARQAWESMEVRGERKGCVRLVSREARGTGEGER